ncbi:MAG TPA: DEAD/DEAH box helicase [Nocardioidaceae bacterium]|nr:DEAD/DEAH box helicase [Nocardioidaceae bacterium]
MTALDRAGITTPFPIQAATLPDSLAGRDVLGRGRTGSGKTYAFVLPVLARLAQSDTQRKPNRPRALILAPTRELATQINASLAPLAAALGLRSATVFGGVPAKAQISKLRAGVDVVIACPGRLVDHLQTGNVKLDAIEITVLDEADHMADLGFLPDVRRLLDATPGTGQRMLFSATLDSGVDVLVRRYLSNPVTHSVDSAQSPVTAMDHHLLHIDHAARIPVLVDLASAPGRTLVFTRTKHGAAQLARKLTAAGVPSVDLHGNLSQGVRTRNLKAFSDGSATTMVATDIAARGIHVDDIGLVVHADPPVEHKAYLHRSGRTARAGAAGTVVTLMTDRQVSDVRALTRKAGIKATVTRAAAGHPVLEAIAPGERHLVHHAVALTAVDDAPRGRRGRTGQGRSASAQSRNRSRVGKDTTPRRGGSSGHGKPARSGSRPESSGAAAFSGGARRRRGR